MSTAIILPQNHDDVIALAHEIAPTMPGATWYAVCQAAEQQLDDLRTFAQGWDAWADTALLAAYAPVLAEDEPEAPEAAPPVPGDAQHRKAAFYALQGVTPLRHGQGWLVASGSRAAVIHFVSNAGVCSCEAGQNARPCWHQALVEQYVERIPLLAA